MSINDRLKFTSSNESLSKKLFGNASITDRKELTEIFQKASSSEHQYLKDLDYNNDIAILMWNDPISNRRSSLSFIKERYQADQKDTDEFIQFLLHLSHEQLMENIREAEKLLNAIIQEMNEIIKIADIQIEKIQDYLQDLTYQHRQLNDLIEANAFEKDKQGHFKSEVIESTIKAYEQRTGQNIPSDISINELIKILEAQKNYEVNTLIPSLEHELLSLDKFRNSVQDQKDTFEEELEKLQKMVKQINNDKTLSEDERSLELANVLEKVSTGVLDAEIALTKTRSEYLKLLDSSQSLNIVNQTETYLAKSIHENSKLNQMALDNLDQIKPLIP